MKKLIIEDNILNEEDKKNVSTILDAIIKDIEDELENSASSIYYCKDGTPIWTDVGYVSEWFEEYKRILYKRYCPDRIEIEKLINSEGDDNE